MDAWPGWLPAPSRRQRLGIQMRRWKWRAKDASAAGRARCHGDTAAKPGEERTRTGMDWGPPEPQESRDREGGPSSTQLNPPERGLHLGGRTRCRLLVTPVPGTWAVLVGEDREGGSQKAHVL